MKAAVAASKLPCIEIEFEIDVTFLQQKISFTSFRSFLDLPLLPSMRSMFINFYTMAISLSMVIYHRRYATFNWCLNVRNSNKQFVPDVHRIINVLAIFNWVPGHNVQVSIRNATFYFLCKYRPNSMCRSRLTSIRGSYCSG